MKNKFQSSFQKKNHSLQNKKKLVTSRFSQEPKGRVVAGHHAIRESLQVFPKGALELWIKKNLMIDGEVQKVLEIAKALKLKTVEKPESILNEKCVTHQGLILFQAESPSWPNLNELDKSIFMLLDGLEDPHNLGAILRTSWLMGVNGIMVPEHRSVKLTPTVHKVASGGAEHVPIEICQNFSPSIETLKSKGYWVFGLSHRAKKNIFNMKLPEKIVWCIGAEDKGIRSTTEKLCDEVVSLPQLSPEASYNASVAASMVLFETFRQHSLK